MHSGVPQLCIKYPEYERVNEQFEIAMLIEEASPEHIAAALNKLLSDDAYYSRLQQNCMEARKVYCWQEQAKTLLSTYEGL
jgi:UDP:flavonoid glycosyltransferase YjiC (YdhE family)